MNVKVFNQKDITIESYKLYRKHESKSSLLLLKDSELRVYTDATSFN